MLYDLRKNSNIVSILQGIIHICIYIDRHTLYFIYIDFEYFLDLVVVQQPSVDIDSIQSISRAIGNLKTRNTLKTRNSFKHFSMQHILPCGLWLVETTTKTRTCMPMCNNDFSSAVAMTNCASKWFGKHKIRF